MHLAKGIASQIKDTIENHVGELEVSQVWYRYPDLIKGDKLSFTEVDFEKVFSPFATRDLLGPNRDTIEVIWNSTEQRIFSPTGSFSNSSSASREKGRLYHEYMVKNLVKFISWLRSYKGPIAGHDKGGNK